MSKKKAKAARLINLEVLAHDAYVILHHYDDPAAQAWATRYMRMLTSGRLNVPDAT